MNQISKLNKVLPQLQCRKCTYKDCISYAKALVNGDRIDRCEPGGKTVITAIAKELQVNPEPFLAKADLPPDLKVHAIDAKNCIGCTKCIDICPTNAIVGSKNFMHDIIASHCSGCGLCIDQCPVDCIAPTEEKAHISQEFGAEQYTKFLQLNQVKNSVNKEIINTQSSILAKQSYIEKIKLKRERKAKNSSNI